MTISIPDTHKYLFEGPILANLATIMPDGRPQVHPVWCDYDGTHIRFSSVQGRQKDANLKERKLATLLLVDPQDPYAWIEVRGRVTEITPEGAEAHIDLMAKKYLGQDEYPWRKAGEVRALYKIEPERVVTFGQ